jgi:hypothetical protein
MQPIAELYGVTAAQFRDEIVPAAQPVVIRGLVRDWPAVAAGAAGDAAHAAYLSAFDTGAPLNVMEAPPNVSGRFFYNDAVDGFNFTTRKTTLSALLAEVIAAAGDAAAPSRYAGANAIAQHLPGFAATNVLPLPLAPDAAARLWVGSASTVPTHYDLSDNVAVVIAGRRRFTLFPPEQVANLYLGPFNITPAGQPVSMVDIANPDHARYPRFAAAWDHACMAELEPGDAIYIPTMWWHDIRALAPYNALVNFWFNYPAADASTPFLAFVHALLAIRDLTPTERAAWRAWFDHFIFVDDPAEQAAHLPPQLAAIQGAAAPARNRAMRDYLLRALSGER